MTIKDEDSKNSRENKIKSNGLKPVKKRRIIRRVKKAKKANKEIINILTDKKYELFISEIDTKIKEDPRDDFKEQKLNKGFYPGNDIESVLDRLEHKHKKNKNHIIILASIIVTIVFLVLLSPPVQRWFRANIPSYILAYIIMAGIIFFTVAIAIWISL